MLRRSILAVVIGLTAACSGSVPTAPPTSSVAAPTVSATDTGPTPARYAGESWQATAQSLAGRIGERFSYLCPPNGVNWFIYGTDVYTSDSSVCTAAVHMGLITLTTGGVATIEMRPGQQSYQSSDRNDIHSAAYGPWGASYVFVGPDGDVLEPGTPGATATPSPTVAATTSPGVGFLNELLDPTLLTICTPFNRIRFAERDASGRPFGVDVEIGQDLAARLGLEPFIQEVAFELLIDEIRQGRCDVTIGGQFITDARLALIDMIPYRQGTQHVIVAAGNPLGIETLGDLCGRTVAIVAGTIHVDILADVSDDCAAAGQPPAQADEYEAEIEAEDALDSGDADAYMGNDFITVERPEDFELSAALPPLRNGIGHRLGLATLDTALRGALRAMISDGSYDAILEKYDVAQVRLTEMP